MKYGKIYLLMVAISLGSPVVASCAARFGRLGQRAQQPTVTAAATQRFYSTSRVTPRMTQRSFSGMPEYDENTRYTKNETYQVKNIPKNKELAPTIAHLRSLDDSLSDARLLEWMNRRKESKGYNKLIDTLTYEAIDPSILSHESHEDIRPALTLGTINAYKNNPTLRALAAGVLEMKLEA